MSSGVGGIWAVVVTFNRKHLLCRCLRALASQLVRPETVLVVDNCSSDGTREMLAAEFPDVKVLRPTENLGGAGGFRAGMEHAARQGGDWFWIMDDDAAPEPDCLAELLREVHNADVLVPIQVDSTGRCYGAGHWTGRYRNAFDHTSCHDPLPIDMFAFVGPLISARTVRTVGLPNERFFIWYDDSEYALRIRQARLRVLLVPRSRVLHDYGGTLSERRFLCIRRMRFPQPAWKTYYISRNYLYTVTRSVPGVRNIVWCLAIQIRGLMGDLAFEEDGLRRVALRARGLLDGSLGRLGSRVRP